jgi:hypothetical protein
VKKGFSHLIILSRLPYYLINLTFQTQLLLQLFSSPVPYLLLIQSKTADPSSPTADIYGPAIRIAAKEKPSFVSSGILRRNLVVTSLSTFCF